MAGFLNKREKRGERNQEIFSELYDRYKDEMYRVAYSVLHNEEDSKDAVQNALIRLYKCIENKSLEDNERKIRAFIWTITKNEACNIYQGNQKQWKLKSQIALEITAVGQRCGIDPSYYVISMEQSDEILECLKKINSEYCDIIHLYYYQNFSIKEMAEVYQISERVMTTKLYRARKSVEKEVERYGLGREFQKRLKRKQAL